jgi:hypothetical protein
MLWWGLAVMVWANTEKLIIKWPNIKVYPHNTLWQSDSKLIFPYSQSTETASITPITNSKAIPICIHFETPSKNTLFELRANWPAIYPLNLKLWISNDKHKKYFMCTNVTFNGLVVPSKLHNFPHEFKLNAGFVIILILLVLESYVYNMIPYSVVNIVVLIIILTCISFQIFLPYVNRLISEC